MADFQQIQAVPSTLAARQFGEGGLDDAGVRVGRQQGAFAPEFRDERDRSTVWLGGVSGEVFTRQFLDVRHAKRLEPRTERFILVRVERADPRFPELGIPYRQKPNQLTITR